MSSFPTYLSDVSANRFIQTYFQGIPSDGAGFIDISGCDFYLRGQHNLYLDDSANIVFGQTTPHTFNWTNIQALNTAITTLTNSTAGFSSPNGLVTTEFIGNTLDISPNSVLKISGNILANSQTISPTIIGYLSGLSSNAQSQINSANTNISNLLNATVNISNSTGLSSGTTTIAGTLALTGNLLVNSKTITPTNLSLLNNLSQNVQLQLNQINSAITNISNSSGVSTVINNNLQITGTSPIIQINSSASGVGSFIINPLSAGTSVSSIQITTSPTASVFNTYQQAGDAVIQAQNSTTGGNLMICSGTTNGLRLTSSQLQVYCDLYANSLTVTPTQLSYLSNLSGDLQSSLNSINTTLTNISYSSGITTINNAITSNNNIQTNGGNFYVTGSGLLNGYNTTNTNGSTVTKMFIGNVQTASTLNTNQQLNDCVINITNGSTAGGSLLICSGTSTNSTGVRFTPSQLQLYMPLYVNSTSISTTQLSYLSALTQAFTSDPQSQINTINGTLSNISNTSGTTSGSTVLTGTVRLSGTMNCISTSNLNLNGSVSVTGNITANSLTVTPTNLGNVSGLTDLPVIVSTAQTVAGIKTFTGACVFSNAGAGVSFTGTAPTLSGANITSGSIPSTSVNLSSVALTGDLTLVPPASFTTPTSGQLGYTVSAQSTVNTSFTSGSVSNLLSVALTAGVWVISWEVTAGFSTTQSLISFGLTTTSGGVPIYARAYQSNRSYTSQEVFTGCRTQTLTSSATWYLTTYCNFTGTAGLLSGNYTSLIATRVA